MELDTLAGAATKLSRGRPPTGRSPATSKAAITKRLVRGAHAHPVRTFAFADDAGRLYNRVETTDPLYTYVFPQGERHAREMGLTLFYVRFATRRRAELATAAAGLTARAALRGMGVDDPGRRLRFRSRQSADVFEGTIKTFVREHASAMGYVILRDIEHVGNRHALAAADADENGPVTPDEDVGAPMD